MSARDHNQAELHDAAMAAKCAQLFQHDRADVLAGDVKVTRELCNSLLEHFANSAALTQLVRTALSTGAQVTGLEFVRILTDVMHANVEAQAERELAADAARTAADPENCKPSTRTQAAQLERMNV